MTDHRLSTPLHAIIVGCGRVGAGMAERLAAEGYSVTVIDQAPKAFVRLDGIAAERMVGMGYDLGTLLDAGVERAEVLAAVTNGDNTNIVVARTAREHFNVPKVVARIYDPRRAAIYERLGISTVASAQLTTELAIRRVLPDDAGVRWVDPSANVCVVDRSVPVTLAGRALTEIERSGRLRVVAVRRLGVGILAAPDLVFQEGDVVYMAVANDQLAAVDELLGAERPDADAHEWKAGH
jgi:trk system potassium uptake protein TrkA